MAHVYSNGLRIVRASEAKEESHRVGPKFEEVLSF